jgi:YihY family inner membrane protein
VSPDRVKALKASLAAAVRRFREIDGEQRAAAFAYYAFFSFLPLTLVLITIGSLFVDRTTAAEEVINALDNYIPVGEMTKRQIFGTINGIVSNRAPLGAVAFALLIWSAVQFFKALIRANNRARNLPVYSWWRLRLKSLLLLSLSVMIAVLASTISVLEQTIREAFFPMGQSVAMELFTVIRVVTSICILFGSICLFYMLGSRQAASFREVWPAATGVTILLRLLENLFGLYLENVSRINLVYGGFGGLLALLLWLYLTGCVLIFGACLCATQSDETD